MQKLFFLFTAVMLLSLMSCKKSDDPKPAPHLLSVYLSDNPADLDEVRIDIHSVEVKIDEGNSGDEQMIARLDDNRSNDSLGAPGLTLWHGGIPAGDSNEYGKWMALDFTPGVYDILKLRNGIDMLLGSVETPGTVRKIRVALGNNNSVVKEGTQYPLSLSDDSTNHHIYIDVLKESRIINGDGSVAVYLDFDLGRSVTENEGSYLLFPYLRTLPADRSLEIEGYAFPAEAAVMVSVYNNTDTATVLPGDDGYFKIRGLELGRYNVKYHAGNSAYKDTTIQNFDITINKVVLPEMTLSKH
ncbi:MAG: DUF4382 domain-containing protein [Sphingobacteriales bacterium]|nr:DUF4382 domain-containing protein [Sphingobacteriales bacterium]OJY87534.1 MAG: hypothetical protein BGP14_12455 [Sphingobacteriales bacterium 44-15]